MYIWHNKLLQNSPLDHLYRWLHSESISLRMKSWQNWPQLQNKDLERWINSDNAPRTVPESAGCDCQHCGSCQHPTSGHNKCSLFDNCRSTVCATWQPLPLEALSAVYAGVVSWMAVAGRKARPWAEVKCTGHTCANQLGVALQKDPNFTSVISRSLQNVQHSHLQSLSVDGKYNRLACAF